MKPRPKPQDLDLQGRLLLVFVVIAGYVVTFDTISSQEESSLTVQAVVLGLSFGVVHLLLAIDSRLILDHMPTDWAEVLFFSTGCSLKEVSYRDCLRPPGSELYCPS